MSLVVPKRKIRARVRLADATVLDGHLYAALAGPSGRAETVGDRLNNSTERYVPFALEDRHLLLNKASIVTVQVPGAECGGRDANGDWKELWLQVELADGTSVVGRTYAEMAPERARALDYLNLRASRFIDLLVEDQALLVNGDSVVSVTEVLVPAPGEEERVPVGRPASS